MSSEAKRLENTLAGNRTDCREHRELLEALAWLTESQQSHALRGINERHVLAAARATKTPDTQRLVYISSKGLTGDGLSALGYSDTIIFRPGFLKGRDTKQAFMANALDGLMSILPGYKNHMQVHVADLGKAVVTAGLLGTAGLPKAAQATEQPANGHKFTLIGNVGALGLASLSSA
ncbi:SubName: Full=Uncharacterized protein {ECO:0000313/EMBL:CCA71840.1} [Serendipita indica DSM 11827]|nr:SubName: Full=Uncharacterized protein {ECO:0000313/EMBL:CCA71840.1} [Serendipita indica DSM 11827]